MNIINPETILAAWGAAIATLLSPAGIKVYLNWKKEKEEAVEKKKQLADAKQHEKDMAELLSKLNETTEVARLEYQGILEKELESLRQANILTLQQLQAASKEELDKQAESNRVEAEKEIEIFNQNINASIHAIKAAWSATYLAYTQTRHLYKKIKTDLDLENTNRSISDYRTTWVEIRDNAERDISKARKEVRTEQPFFQETNLGEKMMNCLSICADFIRSFDTHSKLHDVSTNSEIECIVDNERVTIESLEKVKKDTLQECHNQYNEIIKKSNGEGSS